jgi:hypothetical protein
VESGTAQSSFDLVLLPESSSIAWQARDFRGMAETQNISELQIPSKAIAASTPISLLIKSSTNSSLPR